MATSLSHRHWEKLEVSLMEAPSSAMGLLKSVLAILLVPNRETPGWAFWTDMESVMDMV